jgi:hypothetical protein
MSCYLGSVHHIRKELERLMPYLGRLWITQARNDWPVAGTREESGQ